MGHVFNEVFTLMLYLGWEERHDNEYILYNINSSYGNTLNCKSLCSRIVSASNRNPVLNAGRLVDAILKVWNE